MLLLISSLIAGMLTVLAPCVLALLPIIIGGSVQGDSKDRKRPIIIAVSLALSIFTFTLLLKATSLLVAVDPRVITYISGGIIILVGLLTFFPQTYAVVLAKLGIESRAQTALGKSFQNKRQFIGPIVTGAALGPVFSSCSPVYAYILATVLPVNFGEALAYIVSYIIGLSGVLLLIGYYGQRFIARIKFASDPKGSFQRIIAILFVIVGLLVFTGYDKRVQTYVSNHTPFNFDSLSSKLLPKRNNAPIKAGLLNVAPYAAPEFTGVDQWINSKPLTMAGLKGKVVLVDFWTYSCINCIRNNPYIEKWYETYKDQGFVAVGVHAPEFAFEKVKANVEQAVKDQHITYPVVLDNDLTTWAAFQNRSWPCAYLIDAQGNVRRIHEGEGEYADNEAAIRALLTQNGADLSHVGMAADSGKVPISNAQTPETYLGLRRASNYRGTPALGVAASNQLFTAQPSLKSDEWTLSGRWDIGQEKITAGKDAKLQLKFSAKDVYIVAGADTPSAMSVRLNGKLVDSSTAGADVTDGQATVDGARLYKLVHFDQLQYDQLLELTVPAGTSLNAFTFGS